VQRVVVDAAGNVGIGTASPNAKLTVYTGTAGNLAHFTDGINADFYIKTSSLVTTIGPNAGSTNMAFQTGGTERMRIAADGKVYVGTDIFAGSHRVARSWPSGTVRILEFQAGAVVRGGIDWNGTTLSLATGSDERLKENIRNLEDIGLDKINQIKVRRYEMKESSVPGVGFIAQEMEKVLPEAVSNVGDYLSVSYNEMTPYLVKVIQEQQAMIEELKAKVSALESK